MARVGRRALGLCAGGGLLLLLGAGPASVRPPSTGEVVAVGVPRPLELVLDGRLLAVLSPGLRGDSAGEIYRIDLEGELPVDLSRQPRVEIPRLDASMVALGSLALDPRTRELFLGEENGSRVYRLGHDGRLGLFATGLHRLVGGSTLAFDPLGRLVIVDYVDPMLSRDDDETAPPGLEQFREEDYRGPLVFRLAPDAVIPLPRRLERSAPLFPRAWGGRAGGALLPRLISVVAVGTDDLVFLTSAGDLFRFGGDGTFALYARLPRGQYNRTNLVAAPDGTIFVSGGFHVGRVFRVSPAGTVSLVAEHLADPEGLALDAPRGDLYVAESSLHRVIRLAVFTPPADGPRR